MAPRCEALPPAGLLEAAIGEKQNVVQQQALIGDGAAEGRHRARGDSAHIGVVAPRGHKEQGVPIDKHRCDRRDVR